MNSDYDISFNSVFNCLLVIGTAIDFCIADAIPHILACTSVGVVSQRAVCRWWGAHASCLLDQYRVIYKQFFPNNY